MKCHFYWEMWLESASVQLSFGASKYELWSGTIFEWRKEEKGNVFVEKEVFLLSQSGTLFRRSHTRKSWMGVTFGKDFLESLSRISQLIDLNFPNVFNWDHTLKSISNGGLSLFKCSQLKNLLWESLIKEFQLDQVYFPRYLYPPTSHPPGEVISNFPALMTGKQN